MLPTPHVVVILGNVYSYGGYKVYLVAWIGHNDIWTASSVNEIIKMHFYIH